MTVAQALRPPSRTLLLLEGRAVQELGAFMLLRPWLSAAPRGDGHPVLVFPGLLASDLSTQPLRGFLKAQGYAGARLEAGPQSRPAAGRRGRHARPHRGALRAPRQRKLSLVGWSLGGIYARQLAKRVPDKVRSRDQPGQSVRRQPQGDQRLEGLRVRLGPAASRIATDHIAGPLSDPPPVPTTSVFSRSDGICAWQTCLNEEAPRSRTSRSMAAIAGSATIRPPSMPSPTGWRSPKASGRSSTAPAGRAWSIPTGVVA